MYMHIYVYVHVYIEYGVRIAIQMPEKLFGDGFSTPMPLLCLICTIISNKPCILDYCQKTNFERAGVDTSGRVRHPPYSKRLFVRYMYEYPVS